MLNVSKVLIFAALVAVLIGCGASKEKALVGKWVVDADALTKDAGNDPAAAMAAGMAKSMTIEFKEDKTFTMSMIFQLEGKWSLTGDIVSLDITKAMGQPVPADQKAKNKMQFTMSADGKMLTAVKKPDDKSKFDLKFKKEGG